VPRLFRALTFLLLATTLAFAASQPAAGLARADAPWLTLDSITQSAPAQAQPGPIVRQSFNHLVDYFVVPPESGIVLNGGLDAAEEQLQAKGIGHALTERPAWTNNRNADWALFLEAYDTIAQKAGAALPREELDRAVVSGMAQAMHEGHTYYMSPEHFRDTVAQLTNRESFVGIGVALTQDRAVSEVFEGSPAEAAGVLVGDEIVLVNGESIEGLAPNELSLKIRGEAGTTVTIGVRRDGQSDLISLTITRAQIARDWVQARVLDGQYRLSAVADVPGELRCEAFVATSDDRFSAAQVNGLVIDLRYNGGGSVDTGQDVASLFLAENTPLYQRVDRRGGERTVTTWGQRWDRDVPIAVLTNAYSGSMSEILAAALQETGVAKVFGTKTAGVVSAAIHLPLADGSGLSVTVQLIKSGQGRALDVIGLAPDEVIELDTEQLRRGQDNQLEAALTYVQQQSTARTSGQ
jgi:carboxyl-terminal processing protease